jgi:DNA repair exonuclease SbcCD nuclease subunit
MKILVLGDMHFKDNLSYADYVADKRVEEKKGVHDFIVNQASDCDHVVLMGDNFNSKNNSSETNREFVEFIERFGSKETYIISGNHEKKGDGKTAIDFLGEIHKKNWHIFTKPGTVSVGEEPSTIKLDFLPYMLNSELDVETSQEAAKVMMDDVGPGDILFAHHMISGTVVMGTKVEMFSEPVLDQATLESKYKLVVAGHIHGHQQYGRVLITGSVFTSEVGETEKFIWKIDTDTMTVNQIKVPQRAIYKFTDPTTGQLLDLPTNSIVKVIVTSPVADLEEIQRTLDRFDASLLIQDIPDDRKKMKIEEGQAFDFSIEALLKLYAESKGVDHEKLVKGLELIS